MNTSDTPARMRPMSAILFGSRWLQLPLYLGLIVAQCVYVFHFMVELWHLVAKVPNLGEADIMLIVLGLIDVVMISNLLIMVIIGGYETFVSRLNLSGHPDEPDWLSHVNANLLKVKLATAIIGISSIHLLKTFINAPNLDDRVMMWQTLIHMAFVASAISIAYIDKLMAGPVENHAQKH
ncbi:MAG: TIGR00645 family protein [Pseudomonadota bacterium]